MNKKISGLVLLASSLQVLESYFPHPIPGVRLGLANFVSLFTIIKFGLNNAIKVTIFRTICSSMFLGTFLSITFILSFISGLVSTITMWFMYQVFSGNKIFRLSPLGISITGAVAHNLSQLVTVYLLFIRQKEIFYFLPILIFSAVLTGCITGVVTLYVLEELEKQECKISQLKIETSEILNFTNFVWYSGKVITVFIMFVLCVLLFIVYSLKVQIFILICMLIMYNLTKPSYKILFSNLFRVRWLIFVSIFIPLIFSRHGKIIFSIANFPLITIDGLSLVLSYIFRVVVITLISSFFIQKFTKDELSFILGKLLFFYPDTGEIFAYVLIKFPDFVENVRGKFNIKTLLRFKNLRLTIAQPIAELIKEVVYL